MCVDSNNCVKILSYLHYILWYIDFFPYKNRISHHTRTPVTDSLLNCAPTVPQLGHARLDSTGLNTAPSVFNHPSGLTDSFVLFVKSAILISRVTTFNRRFLKLNALGVSGMSVTNMPSSNHLTSSGSLNEYDTSSRRRPSDAREVGEFLKLENDVESFPRSFPANLQKPIAQDGAVDWTLLNVYFVDY